MVKSACNTGDAGLIPGTERYPRVENGTPVSLAGKSQGQRKLAGYSSWGHKELDTTW